MLEETKVKLNNNIKNDIYLKQLRTYVSKKCIQGMKCRLLHKEFKVEMIR